MTFRAQVFATLMLFDAVEIRWQTAGATMFAPDSERNVDAYRRASSAHQKAFAKLCDLKFSEIERSLERAATDPR